MKHIENYYIDVLKKYAVFSGRSRRAEYWYFALFNFIIIIALNIISSIIGIDSGILLLLFYLAVFIPALAVAVRRLHDTGRSGWMILVSFIPLIGLIWIIILMATDSTPGENKYGPNPKGITAPQPTDVA